MDYHPDQPWIRVAIRGGAYDPTDAQEALDEVLRKKTEDQRYRSVRKEFSLGQLHLLVHYDTRAVVYNTPAITPWNSFDDVAQQAGIHLNSPGAFDHVFLFVAARFPVGESSQARVFQIV
jgi:hypothetical protein